MRRALREPLLEGWPAGRAGAPWSPDPELDQPLSPAGHTQGVRRQGRQGIGATGADAAALRKPMAGGEIFEPDWSDIGTRLDTYVDAWKSATGS